MLAQGLQQGEVALSVSSEGKIVPGAYELGVQLFDQDLCHKGLGRHGSRLLCKGEFHQQVDPDLLEYPPLLLCGRQLPAVPDAEEGLGRRIKSKDTGPHIIRCLTEQFLYDPPVSSVDAVKFADGDCCILNAVKTV